MREPTVGDRVKYSQKWIDHGWRVRGRNVPYAQNRGVVTGFARTSGCLRVLWDSSKTKSTLHASFLEVVDA